ncbi:hypothetical protein V1520DRAFT_343144 [Lipomyces starkeyi]|uniref:Uncharacterized protein n=1 Tax=Lipomyces starkeyi NRRL Y-11557 TaxID=675824 RepID=A0A1E3QCX2_LIPST|nr:hypothetical protein LIPSTDRAFT_68081 [Lipomyces starkeyi NRRL Y-11557]
MTEHVHIRHPATVAAATQPKGTSSSLASLLEGIEGPGQLNLSANLRSKVAGGYVTTIPPVGWLAINLGMRNPCAPRTTSVALEARAFDRGSLAWWALLVYRWLIGEDFVLAFFLVYPCDPMAVSTIHLFMLGFLHWSTLLILRLVIDFFAVARSGFQYQ